MPIYQHTPIATAITIKCPLTGWEVLAHVAVHSVVKHSHFSPLANRAGHRDWPVKDITLSNQNGARPGSIVWLFGVARHKGQRYGGVVGSEKDATDLTNGNRGKRTEQTYFY
ncbi:hypothetical protein BaRGS_00023815 [Batillaria attramentaria]|uniref:Uncharacterized protein n=1 Tax=Batillaria attramentaria TaxID=370345 RepID=A0ABD0KD37_9CAEN